ncbi:MAG TPA: FAD-dependent oxidoreductase [Sedimentisphaerales bacterium]|nr:FAD-dependent oxidoreductase [Sedimentisphaerales bacterium]
MKRRKFIKLAAAAAGWVASSHAAGQEAVQRHSPAAKPGSSISHIDWSRQIPVRYEADVAVIGGGIAGVSAACAAARSGAKVILVERFAVTGGNMTSGGVANFCGQVHGQGEVFDEILADLAKFGAISLPETVFDHEILAIVLQELLLRRKVKLLLHTRFVDVRVKNGRITECIICGKSGPQALRACQFIDCTGDGDVARAAGFEIMKGRWQDHLQLPMSMMCFVRHVEPQHARPQLPEGWFEPVRSKNDLPMTSKWPNGPGSNALKIKIPMFDSTDTESLTGAEIRARRRMMEVLDYYQRIEKKPWLLDHCSPIIGIREGCRIVGDYVLKVEDLRAGRAFEDGVARGTFYLDAHKPDDDKRTYILSKSDREVPPYQIPLRSLIARDGRNLMMAGRCFSADQLALSSARVSTSASMMGQAAGITAAMSTQKRCDPRQLEPADVRKIVERRGAQLAL